MKVILETLGFKNINDTETIIDIHSFEYLNPRLVIDAIKEYGLCDNILEGNKILSTELKFQCVNRILEFRHEMIIDPTKDMDELPTGFRLEKLVAN